MIQRIQTLYLTLLVILMVLLYCFPIATFISGTETFELDLFGIRSLTHEGNPIVSTIWMGILAILCTLIPLITIFLYKRRWAQIRLCIIEMILLGGLQLFVLFYIYRTYTGIQDIAQHAIRYSLIDVFPFIGIILTYLAFRGIARDEALIRSLNRMR